MLRRRCHDARWQERRHLLALGGGYAGGLVVQLLADVLFPDRDYHVWIWTGPRRTTRGEMFVADVDIVAGVLETDGLAPGRELGPGLFAGGVDVRSGTATRPDDLTTLAEGGQECLLLTLDHFRCREASGN